jgi:hypothetical protein
MADDLVRAARDLRIPTPDIIMQVVGVGRVDVVLHLERLIGSLDLEIAIRSLEPHLGSDNIRPLVLCGDHFSTGQLLDPSVIIPPLRETHGPRTFVIRPWEIDGVESSLKALS